MPLGELRRRTLVLVIASSSVSDILSTLIRSSAIGIARCFAYGGKKSRPLHDPDVPPALGMSKADYMAQKNSPSLNHFAEKLFLLKDLMCTEQGRAIAEERHAFMHQFVDRFKEEWNGQA